MILSLNKSRSESLLSVLSGSVFMAIAANLSVPWEPVPFTFQTTAALLIAEMLGSELGTYSLLAYLIEGSLGVPVFAGFTSGFSVIIGPTGGYLLGLLPAVYVAGILFKKSSNLLTISAVVLSFLTIVFACGYLQLCNFVGFKDAYLLGVAPFFITEMFKAIAVIISIYKSKKC